MTAATQRFLRVGLCNDSPAALKLLRAWFTAQGHVTFGVSIPDSRDPVADFPTELAEFGCDVIVFDVGVPLASAWVFLEAMRGAEPYQQIPFIVTTRNLDVLEAQVGRRLGVYEFTGSAENLVALLQLVEKAGEPKRSN